MNLPKTEKELELYYKLNYLATLNGRRHTTLYENDPGKLSNDPDEIKYQKAKEEYLILVNQHEKPKQI